MATIRKAQFGKLVRGAMKAAVKGVDKKIVKSAEKDVDEITTKGNFNSTPKSMQKPTTKVETKIDARAKKIKKNNDSYDQSVWDSYQRNGGKTMKKAQGGKKVSYTNLSGSKVSMDTTGYAGGSKKFPTMIEYADGTKGYGFAKRKSADRAIAKSQGKPAKTTWMTPSQKAKSSFKTGGSIGRSEKQMGLNVKSKSHGDINPASFRKAELKRDSDLIGKRSGEQAPYGRSSKKK